MRKIACLATILFSSSVYGFSNTFPLLAWSSLPSPPLSKLAEGIPALSEQSEVMDRVMSMENLCRHDVILFATQTGLHANDLRALDRDSRISSLLGSSSDSLQLPYTSCSHSSTKSFDAYAAELSKRCGHRVISNDRTEDDEVVVPGEKKIVLLHLHDLVAERPTSPSPRIDTAIASAVERHTAGSKSHLVVLAGSPSLARRGEVLETRQAQNSTLATGGILKRFQLLTPTIIIAILVIFLLYIPLLFLAINALASIQIPRIGGGAKTVSSDRKNQ